MKNSKQVIGVRCHNFGEPEQFLYQTLSFYFKQDAIYFIVDEIKKPKQFPSELNKVSLNMTFVESSELYAPSDLAWSCGDYFYYAFRKQVDADYYWLIEPDVLLNLNSVEAFFGFFENKDIDALVMNFSLAHESWVWYESAKKIADPTYKCFFPLTRLSKKSVEIMLAKRQQISYEHIGGGLKGLFTNDEALLANALMAAGIEPINLSSFFEGKFNFFSNSPFINKELSIEYCQDQILHPVKDIEFYKNALKNNIDDIFNKRLDKIIRNIILDEETYNELKNYAVEVLNKNMLNKLGAPNRINFLMQKISLVFNESSKISLKRIVRQKNSLRFFIGQKLVIAFKFEDEHISAYKQQVMPDSAEYIETFLEVFPIGSPDSFADLEANIMRILQAFEHKKINA